MGGDPNKQVIFIQTTHKSARPRRQHSNNWPSSSAIWFCLLLSNKSSMAANVKPTMKPNPYAITQNNPSVVYLLLSSMSSKAASVKRTTKPTKSSRPRMKFSEQSTSHDKATATTIPTAHEALPQITLSWWPSQPFLKYTQSPPFSSQKNRIPFFNPAKIFLYLPYHLYCCCRLLSPPLPPPTKTSRPHTKKRVEVPDTIPCAFSGDKRHVKNEISLIYTICT